MTIFRKKIYIFDYLIVKDKKAKEATTNLLNFLLIIKEIIETQQL